MNDGFSQQFFKALHIWQEKTKIWSVNIQNESYGFSSGLPLYSTSKCFLFSTDVVLKLANIRSDNQTNKKRYNYRPWEAMEVLRHG